MRESEQSSSPTLRRRQRIRRTVFASLLGLAALVFTALAIAIDRYGRIDRARPAQAIIVLGCRVEPDGTAGDSLRARTLHAVSLYERGYAPALIFTGGVGKYPPAESIVAAELAEERSVPAAAIFREERSTNTSENARYAAEICRTEGWTRVIVVSDPYHLFRARRNFERVGLTVYTSPAVNCRRHRNPLYRAWWTAREAVAVTRDAMAER